MSEDMNEGYFLSPIFKINRDVNASMIGLSKDFDKFYILEGKKIITKNIARRPKKILLAEIGQGQGLYLKDNGVVEADFIEN
jgi:hypothetical protein